MREDYAKLVSELKKPGLLICEEMTPFKADLLHMAIGIMGEVVEYMDAESPEHKLEELGDIYFFVEGMRQILPNNIASEYKRSHMINAASELLDLVKKVCIYNKPITPILGDITARLLSIKTFVKDKACHDGFTASQVIEANMAKLNKRYSSGSYSNKQAIERVDKND